MGKAIVEVSAEYFLTWLQRGVSHGASEVIADAVPDDAVMLDIRFNQWNRPMIEILIESATIPRAAEGKELPRLTPVLRVLSPMRRES